MSLIVREAVDGAVRQAAIDGEMTIYAVAALKAEIEGALAGCAELEVDLSGVADIDTAGLQWLLMARRIPGKSVRFAKPSAPVLHLLELSNLVRAIVDDLSAPAGAAAHA